MTRPGEPLNLSVPDLGALIGLFGGAVRELDKAIKRAATKAGRILKKAARAKAPSRKTSIRIAGRAYRHYGSSGALRRSIDANIRKPGQRSGGVSIRWALAWSTYVGAARKYSQMVFARWHRPSRARPAVRDALIRVRPAWYAHLVERGFVAKVFGTGRRVVVPARPFMRPALDANAQSIATLTVAELESQLEKMAQKQRAGK